MNYSYFDRDYAHMLQKCMRTFTICNRLNEMDAEATRCGQKLEVYMSQTFDPYREYILGCTNELKNLHIENTDAMERWLYTNVSKAELNQTINKLDELSRKYMLDWPSSILRTEFPMIRPYINAPIKKTLPQPQFITTTFAVPFDLTLPLANPIICKCIRYDNDDLCESNNLVLTNWSDQPDQWILFNGSKKLLVPDTYVIESIGMTIKDSLETKMLAPVETLYVQKYVFDDKQIYLTHNGINSNCLAISTTTNGKLIDMGRALFKTHHPVNDKLFVIHPKAIKLYLTNHPLTEKISEFCKIIPFPIEFTTNQTSVSFNGHTWDGQGSLADFYYELPMYKEFVQRDKREKILSALAKR